MHLLTAVFVFPDVQVQIKIYKCLNLRAEYGKNIGQNNKLKVSAIITLKKEVLDPQGKVIKSALDGMGFNNINEIRQGKYFEIDIDEKDKKKAEEQVENMCKKLLANLVIEDYKIIRSQ